MTRHPRLIRPRAPNSKGLKGLPTLFLKLHPERLRDLQTRAMYETLHWKEEHGGHGHVISPQDVARRIIDEYFLDVSALPNDHIGRAVLEELEKDGRRYEDSTDAERSGPRR